MEKIINLNKLSPAENQSEILYKFFFNQDQKIKSRLFKKINGYKAQDIKKNIFNNETFITYDELLEKLILSKLKCLYCKLNVLLLFTGKRDSRQWTLDRIDNQKGHSNQNTEIACLKCNLQRRTINSKKFLFTKQMKIIKK